MEQSGRKKAKRIYLVDRSFQLKYTWAAVAVGTFSTTLTAVVILYPLYVFRILMIPRFLPWPILLAMLMAVVINVFAVAVMGVFITHRIAGPVYAIMRQMRRLAAAHWWGQMQVREGDELRLLVRNINEVTDSLAEVAQSDLNQVRQIIAALQGLKSEAEGIAQACQIAAALELALEERLGPRGMDRPSSPGEDK